MALPSIDVSGPPGWRACRTWPSGQTQPFAVHDPQLGLGRHPAGRPPADGPLGSAPSMTLSVPATSHRVLAMCALPQTPLVFATSSECRCTLPRTADTRIRHGRCPPWCEHQVSQVLAQPSTERRARTPPSRSSEAEQIGISLSGFGRPAGAAARRISPRLTSSGRATSDAGPRLALAGRTPSRFRTDSWAQLLLPGSSCHPHCDEERLRGGPVHLDRDRPLACVQRDPRRLVRAHGSDLVPVHKIFFFRAAPSGSSRERGTWLRASATPPIPPRHEHRHDTRR